MKFHLVLWIVALSFPSLSAQTISKIAFGSCGHQKKPQPVLKVAASNNPDVFIFMGDNIYGDTKRMNVLKRKYSLLGNKPEFKQLWNKTKVLATWDDHDYGVNDGGLEYPKKEASKKVFLNFWKEEKEADRWRHAGIYASYYFGEAGRRVQIILLDTRTFRTALLPAKGKEFRNDYRPNSDGGATILGSEQWAWLEKELSQPAEVRIIGTSTQFGITYNGYEAWANFPLEQQRMVSLIEKSKAKGVLFISGDVHYAELSVIQENVPYPLHDLTSSGITQTWGHVEANENRVGEAYRDNNFGLLSINWELPDPAISLEIINVANEIVLSNKVSLSQLQ